MLIAIFAIELFITFKLYLMSLITAETKRKLENEICKTHNQKATLKFISDTKVKITACCDEFNNKLEDLLTEEIANNIIDQLHF